MSPHRQVVHTRNLFSLTLKERAKMPRTVLLHFLTAGTLLLASGCATTSRVPPFAASAIMPYKNIALIQTNTNELLFVTSRRYPQAEASGPLMKGNNATSIGNGPLVVGNSAGATVVGTVLAQVMTDAKYRSWVRSAQIFNDALPKEMKSEMDQRLYAQLTARIRSRGIDATRLAIDADPGLFYYLDESVIKTFAESVRKQCGGCDAALIVHAGYGFHQVPYVGLRAQAEADVLLISLPDGVLRSRSVVTFVETKNKYDYPYDTELLRDIVRAGKWIPTTVEPLASLILADGKSP
jgi:hypothetical protein